MFNYGFIDRQTNEILDVRCGTEAARKAVLDRGGREDIFIQPVMLHSDYQREHRDFRSEIDGKPWLLYMDIKGATVLGPVVLLDQWGKWSGKEHHTPLQESFR